MRIYDLRGENGRLRAFEVDNHLLSRRAVALLVARLPGVRIIRAKSSWWADDEFCKFVVGGVEFTAWEPFGDNSRYWIGPSEATDTPQLERVRLLFQTYRPPVASFSLGVLVLVATGLFVFPHFAGALRSLFGSEALVLLFLGAAAALVIWLWYRDRRLMARLPWSDDP